MKILKMSSFAALIACLSLFASCTKDAIDAPSSASSPESYDYYTSAAAKGAAGKENLVEETETKKATVTFTVFEIKTSPSSIGSTIVINGTVTFSEPIRKANIIVEKATTKDVLGKWNNWTAVPDFGGKLQLSKADAPQASFSFANTFTATEVGESGWRIHVTGGDVENAFSNENILEITDCVKELTVEPQVTGRDLGNGNYEFTVTYKLTSPIEIADFTFQGGASSGGQFQHQLKASEGFDVKHNNQNSVLTYSGSLKACTPLEMSFTYVRKYKCAEDIADAITGNWTMVVNNEVVKEVTPLTYSCN